VAGMSVALLICSSPFFLVVSWRPHSTYFLPVDLRVTH
jgi:hypothetical protein